MFGWRSSTWTAFNIARCWASVSVRNASYAGLFEALLEELATACNVSSALSMSRSPTPNGRRWLAAEFGGAIPQVIMRSCVVLGSRSPLRIRILHTLIVFQRSELELVKAPYPLT